MVRVWVNTTGRWIQPQLWALEQRRGDSHPWAVVYRKCRGVVWGDAERPEVPRLPAFEAGGQMYQNAQVYS